MKKILSYAFAALLLGVLYFFLNPVDFFKEKAVSKAEIEEFVPEQTSINILGFNIEGIKQSDKELNIKKAMKEGYLELENISANHEDLHIKSARFLSAVLMNDINAKLNGKNSADIHILDMNILGFFNMENIKASLKFQDDLIHISDASFYIGDHIVLMTAKIRDDSNFIVDLSFDTHPKSLLPIFNMHEHVREEGDKFLLHLEIEEGELLEPKPSDEPKPSELEQNNE